MMAFYRPIDSVVRDGREWRFVTKLFAVDTVLFVYDANKSYKELPMFLNVCEMEEFESGCCQDQSDSV